MGKYDAVIQKLPRLPPEIRYSDQGGSNYQYRVDEAKGKYTDRDPAALLKQYAEARAKAEEKEQEAKDLRLEVEALTQLMMDAFEGRGLSSIKLKDVGTVRAEYVPHTSVKDKAAYRQWCIDNGHADQMQLIWSTTNNIMAEKVITGQEIPDCVEVYCRPRPVFTREK